MSNFKFSNFLMFKNPKILVFIIITFLAVTIGSVVLINNSQNSNLPKPTLISSSSSDSKIIPNSTNSDSSQNSNSQNLYFKGKIGDSPIRMVLKISSNNSIITDSAFVNWYTGSYIYENKSNEKIILVCGIIRSEQVAKLDSNHQFNGVGTKFKEFKCDESVIKSEMRTGSMQGIIHATGSFADESFDNQFSGTWSNADKTVNLPFSLEKVYEFNLENYYARKMIDIKDTLRKKNMSAQDRKQLYQRLKWAGECEDDFGQGIVGDKGEYEGNVKVFNFSDTELLINASCGCGAYQCWSNLVYYDEKNDISKLLEFDSYKENSDKTKKNLLTSAGFDPITKKLETYNKYAGHGGCGYTENYNWNNNLKNFKLSKFVQNSDCDNPVGTDKWKMIYQK